MSKEMHLVLKCIGANGIQIYRKSENKDKEMTILDSEFKKLSLKRIQPGSWVDIGKNESAVVFNNDSIGLLRKDKISIVYAVKIIDAQDKWRKIHQKRETTKSKQSSKLARFHLNSFIILRIFIQK